eukprot:9626020-Alexandrium_andersonii.AAC.1
MQSPQPDGRLSRTQITVAGASCIARMAAMAGFQKSTQSMTCCLKTWMSPRSTSKIAWSVISTGCRPNSTRRDASGIFPRLASTSSVTSLTGGRGSAGWCFGSAGWRASARSVAACAPGARGVEPAGGWPALGAGGCEGVGDCASAAGAAGCGAAAGWGAGGGAEAAGWGTDCGCGAAGWETGGAGA